MKFQIFILIKCTLVVVNKFELSANTMYRYTCYNIYKVWAVFDKFSIDQRKIWNRNLLYKIYEKVFTIDSPFALMDNPPLLPKASFVDS